MKNIAKHCKTLQNIAKHCKTLQNIAKHCKTLQNIAKHCKTLQNIEKQCETLWNFVKHCETLQNIAKCCFQIGLGTLPCPASLIRNNQSKQESFAMKHHHIDTSDCFVLPSAHFHSAQLLWTSWSKQSVPLQWLH